MLRVIFGGTFDPIHKGHVQTSLAAFTQLKAERLHVMPSAQPPHRGGPTATAEQRLEMVRLAFTDYPQVIAEPWELDRQRLSYSLLTLQEMQQQWPEDTLVFLLGDDAFAKLNTWHRWQELVQVAHLAVMQRPDQDVCWAAEVEQLAQQRRVTDSHALKQQQAGCILCLDTPAIDVSATALRSKISHQQPWEHLVPPAVAHYIKQHQLYP